uniref:BCL2 associated agonist of cell death b n=1 Tax=Monopterus albus TaxID=43700 RepID=A0A3Q3R5S3_MONAL|nr:bcl2-associated agonist of cell death [Monopterus albus]XP_020465841.1 bcl2-associated agonist of cell death [Monopterus albus]XP_020465842.1 bcl2-associated agonist of cell death [Monopterus albus]XP_020465844.1 bcl2-associated agonist of cell death [Monopterus albus]XP_020465845.1 bcl2-associated agonist of cell death [Monopterus albus]XP_020465846.1 bcl2-associated agonist of cell death [Monopterus albus]
MAANFTISDSESESSEEVEEGKHSQSSTSQEQQVPPCHSLTLPELRMAATSRNRVSSESNASTVQDAKSDEEAGTPTDGAPFRGRSKSAPPALWAAKKYGRQLRRMSDEFDSLLDKGEMKRVRSAGAASQMHHSKSWWSYLFSHQETEGENTHHENAALAQEVERVVS